MTEENKQLLLKDLSSRLPYKITVQFKDGSKRHLVGLTPAGIAILSGDDKPITTSIENIQPLLRDMDDMTPDQEFAYEDTLEVVYYMNGNRAYNMTAESIDWLNEHDFDYRGLLAKGLARLKDPDYIRKCQPASNERSN